MSNRPNQPVPDGEYKIAIIKPEVESKFVTIERHSLPLAFDLYAREDRGDASNWLVFWSNQHTDKPDALMTLTPAVQRQFYVVKSQNNLQAIPAPQVQPDENLWIFEPTGEKDTFYIADLNKKSYWILGGSPKAKLALGTSKSNRVQVKFEVV